MGFRALHGVVSICIWFTVNTPCVYLHVLAGYVLLRTCLAIYSTVAEWIFRNFGDFPVLTKMSCFILKTIDTIGNCQKPVFSLGVPQHMHKKSM